LRRNRSTHTFDGPTRHALLREHFQHQLEDGVVAVLAFTPPGSGRHCDLAAQRYTTRHLTIWAMLRSPAN
jgi:hypothetical protein